MCYYGYYAILHLVLTFHQWDLNLPVKWFGPDHVLYTLQQLHMGILTSVTVILCSLEGILIVGDSTVVHQRFPN